MTTMSVTAGTWETVAFATLTDVTFHYMFELRGFMFAVVVNDLPNANGVANELWLSRDAGTTWETAASLVALDVASNMEARHPEDGDTPGISSEYAIVNIGPMVVTPAFPGIDFAAELAP